MSRIYRNIYKYNTKQNIAGKDIHHINLNHNDNKLSNLVAVPKELHKRIHKFFYYCEILDILEKYKKDGINRYYSTSNYTAVKDRWVNARNYIKRFDFVSIQNKIIQEVPLIMNELDEALKQKNISKNY